MTDIKKVVDRFLCWPLPRDFSPDCYISFDRANATNPHMWPIGTNLFTADQAREMFEHCLQDEKLQSIESQQEPTPQQKFLDRYGEGMSERQKAIVRGFENTAPADQQQVQMPTVFRIRRQK